MKLSNEEVLITFNADSFLNTYNFEIDESYSYDISEEFENELVFRSFIKEAKSEYGFDEIYTDTWKSLGMQGLFQFNGCKFLILSARWEINWEVTIQIANYPNIISKILYPNLYSQKLQIFKYFSEAIFQSIRDSINPSDLSVCLYSKPKYKTSNINSLEW